MGSGPGGPHPAPPATRVQTAEGRSTSQLLRAAFGTTTWSEGGGAPCTEPGAPAPTGMQLPSHAGFPRTWPLSRRPHGVPANMATVTPSCPHVNRIACGELPCSDEGRVVERILKYLEEKNSKSWASFHFYCHFPWATGQVLPTPRGLRTLSHPHTPRAALAFPPRPGERARRRRLPAGDVRWWC